MIAYDIGANVGECTNWLLNHGYDKIISVEPDSRTFLKLYTRYYQDDRVLLLPIVISDLDGKIIFYESSNHTVSTADQAWITDSRFAGQFIWVPVRKNCITLTQMLGTYGIPKFLKIDVEGLELQVLRGLSHKISCTIGFEWAEEKWDQIQESVRYLQSLGYSEYAFTYADSLDDTLSLIYNSWEECGIHKDIIPPRKNKWGMIYTR